MTTLAQTIVNDNSPYHHPDAKVEDKIRVERLYNATRGLLFPIEITKPKSTDLIPSKFIFSDDAPGVVHHLISKKHLTFETTLNASRPPAPVSWIEWKLPASSNNECPPIRVGAIIAERRILAEAAYRETGEIPSYLVDDHGHSVWGFALGDDGPGVGVMFDIYMPDYEKIGLQWVNPFIKTANNNNNYYMDFMTDLMFALFLINVPRVCEINQVSHDRKLQKCRQKAGRLPLIEYKQMILRVGVGGTRAAHRNGSGVTSDHPDGRRLHEVIGHFRTYTKDRETPMVSYVPHHWRGDPEKGIVLHERVVRS